MLLNLGYRSGLAKTPGLIRDQSINKANSDGRGASGIAGNVAAAIGRSSAHIIVQTIPRVLYGVEQTFFWLNVGTAGLMVAEGALQSTISVCEGINK